VAITAISSNHTNTLLIDAFNFTVKLMKPTSLHMMSIFSVKNKQTGVFTDSDFVPQLACAIHCGA